LATPETCKIGRELVMSGASPDDAGKARLVESLETELASVRPKLWNSARTILAPYLVFVGGGVRELLAHLLDVSGAEKMSFQRRNARAGDRERHLLLYLQRVAAKNDTFGEFGPSGWGKVNAKLSGISIAPDPGIARRDGFLERWTAHAIAAAINADPDNSNPGLRVPALDPHAFEALLEDVEKWPAGASRAKWLPILQALAELPQKFTAATDPKDRRSLLDEASARLQIAGAEIKSNQRFLYSATNPIGEECFRECHFEISEAMINEVATQTEPWIDFWRDTYAFVASRVAAGLRGVLEKAGAKSGIMPLPAFLQACEAARLPLTGPGLVALATIAFQEVKATFRKRLQPQSHLNEYELTPDDCHIVRDNFEYPKFDEYTYPSADLQLAASSANAVERGEYQWILAELHPPPALLHHCMYWSCPDKETLGRALESTAFGRPNFHFGFFAADFTAHTTVRLFDAMPGLSNFVAPQRANPNWRKISPEDAEVYIDEITGDVGVRRASNREHLGSFSRAWVIPLGFHPFQFGMAPHMPRLRCGNVIVQRRSWTVTQADLERANYTGVSANLVLAVEKLRAEKNLPRFVYIRPTEQALRRSGAEGRDKDTKPVFVDLESYLFFEIFYRWLTKAGELEVTEMLPDPEHLLWKEPDGRHTFELRTLIVPR
jgi:Lantibiotic dehydratase, N terminus